MINLEELKKELIENETCSVSQWTYIQEFEGAYGIFHGVDGEMLDEADDLLEAIIYSRKISNELDYKRSKDRTYLVVMPQIGSFAFYKNITLDDLLVKYSTLPSFLFDIYTCLVNVKNDFFENSKVVNNCNMMEPEALNNLIDDLLSLHQIVHYTETNYLYPKKEYKDVEYPDDLKEINILEWGKSCDLLHDNDVKDNLTFYDLFIDIKDNGYDKDRMYSFLNANDSDIITICKTKLDMLVNRLL